MHNKRSQGSSSWGHLSRLIFNDQVWPTPGGQWSFKRFSVSKSRVPTSMACSAAHMLRKRLDKYARSSQLCEACGWSSLLSVLTETSRPNLRERYRVGDILLKAPYI
ncbi:hypothetical protein MAE02_52580 [Microvirga aerophila]|uniref:Uncharacterized protein n=1 Tax=Microvirga aerophila TaxID=670291 RepID=A0A512C028_9HYPH|nr:hypothetical protein MAE02_52580 [Microvirga aerophila]